VAAAPVTALVANAYVAKAVVDAAIVADVRAPIATVKSVAVMPEAPVAGGPESALVGSLNPDAGHPVITGRRPGPVAGGPEVVVAGSLRLFVIGQRRGRLLRIGNRLLSVARVNGRLASGLIICLAGT